MGDILTHWENRPDKVNKDDLMRQVTQMSNEQALELIEVADGREGAADEENLTLSGAMRIVGWIKLSVQKIAQRIEEIMILEKEEKKNMKQLVDKGVLPGVPSGGAMAKSVDDMQVKLDPVSDSKLTAIDSRLSQMEEFLNESMCFTVHRGKEMRNRLSIIEDLLKADMQGRPMNR